MENNNSPQSEQSYHPKHHIKIYVWIGFVVIALLVAVNGYMYFLRLSYLQQGAETARQNEQRIQELRTQRQSSDLEAKLPSNIPADWKTYTNTQYGFEFKYPKEYTVQDSTNVGIPKTDVLIYLMSENDKIEFLVMKNSGIKSLNEAFEMFFTANTNPVSGKINDYQTLSATFLQNQMSFKGIAITDNKSYVGIQTNDYTTQKGVILDQVISTFKFTK